MSREFKVGDIVIGNSYRRYVHTNKGWLGTIIRIVNEYNIEVKGKEGEFIVEKRFFDLYNGGRDKHAVKLNKCSCCNNELNKDDEKYSTVDGEVCESCNEDYFSCVQCDERHHIENSICLGDDLLCSDNCARNRGWFECADCSEWTHAGGSYRNDSGNSICESCRDNYNECHNCNCTVHNDNSHYNEEEDETYCNSCWGDTRVIKPYSYKPREYLMGKMAYENTVYLGIELEVECARDVYPSKKAEIVTEWLTKRGLHDRVYIKEDGSLDNGFEIVFHPMTLKYIHKHFPIRELLAMLSREKITSHAKNTCGLHVHVSKKDLNNRNIHAGKVFFYKCKDYLIKFSARHLDKLNYCKFDSSMPNEWNDQPYGKYSAFNTCASLETMELRLFRGTTVPERFLASLQFSDCFAEYIKHHSVVYMKSRSSQVIWQGFIEFAKSTRQYNHLVKYLLKRGIV